MPMAEPERRSHRRTRVGYPVRVRTESGDEFEGVVDNLGALGALVATPHLEASIEVGASITLAIDTDGAVIEAAGEVLRIEQEFAEGDIRLAFAVRFTSPIEPPE